MNIASMEIELLAGTEFGSAVQEARRLANVLGLAYIKFSFNGVKCSVAANADLNKAHLKFQEAIRSENTYKYIVIGNR